MARVATFRPDDGRLEAAAVLLEDLGVEPVTDPMLAIEPTGAAPRADAPLTILTSQTGVGAALEAGWAPTGEICAIGSTTADALETAGISVDILPETFSSSGLVAELAGDVDGVLVEVARSDRGSQELITGLWQAGAYVHETVLYRLTRPEAAGRSVERAMAGELDGVLFSSSLTVQHFLEIAVEREALESVRRALETAVVGCIGAPTRERAEEHGLTVDVVPAVADYDQLARDVVSRIDT
jgi:uroporphyrinogen-III synthase